MSSTLHKSNPNAWEFAKFLIFFQLITLGIGIVAPLFTINPDSRLVAIFMESETYSLFSVVRKLLGTPEHCAIGFVILAFSIIFPFVKTLLVIWVWLVKKHETAEKIILWVERLGRWSMLDVFVVAVSVCASKSGLVKIEICWGMWVFFSSVLISMGTAFLTQKTSALHLTQAS